MKRSVVIFVIISCAQYIVCQNTWHSDSVMYMAAYKYISNDSINQGNLIAVADSIVDLDRYWVTGLEQFPEECKKLAQYRKMQMEGYGQRPIRKENKTMEEYNQRYIEYFNNYWNNP